MAEMTQQEATREANRRWPRGTVRRAPSKRKMCLVGVRSITNDRFRLKGSGMDWEAAFADADRKEKESK